MESLFDNLNSDKSKRCTRCGEVKPMVDFSPKKRNNGTYGINSECKPCASKRTQKHRKENNAVVRQREKESRISLRKEMIAAYGGKCDCCGESRWEFLSLEHLNGGGIKHFRSRGTRGILKDLKDQGWPKDRYTVLCYNCNFAKSDFGECPHKISDITIQPERQPIEFKTCPICGELKSIKNDFFRDSQSKKGGSYCKDCRPLYKKKMWRLQKLGLYLPNTSFGLGVLRRCTRCDLWKEVKFYFTGNQCICKTCRVIVTRENRQKDIKRTREKENLRNLLTRKEAILAYGGQCVWCGENDWRFLSIDHCNNDGHLERKKRNRAGARLCLHLKKLGYPKDRYQILCFNCNCAKSFRGYRPPNKA